MGKTYTALKRAEDQYREQQVRNSHEVFYKESGSNQGRASVRKYTKRLEDLKNKLVIRNISGSTKSVLFIKTFKGDEPSDQAVKFATLLAKDFRLKVLLIDLNLWTMDLQEVFKIDYIAGLSDLFSDNGNIVSPIKKVGPGNLYKTSWGGNYSKLEDQFESGEFDQFLKNLYKRFDYLVLNAPEHVSFRENRILSSKVDAVALILKSGKIANQIVPYVKKHIESHSNKLLGLVVHKRRTYPRKFFKVSSMLVATSLILAFGFLLGNSRLKPRRTNSIPKYIGVIPNIKSYKPITPDKVADSAQLKHQSKSRVAEEEIREFSESVPTPKQTHKEKLPMTGETATLFTEATVKREQPQVIGHSGNSESDANIVDQPMRDGKKTAGFTVKKEIKKPILSRDNGSEEKRKAELRQGKGKAVVVKKGDTLFRIIYRNYGIYNAKIVNLVLKENPKIISSTHIVAGQVIKLPEIN
jgi:Mrp family chromosome partitioning ATPase